MVQRDVASSKIGKAGELLVANEFLRYGFNIYMPFVDTEIDIVCLLEDRNPVLIQVMESRQYPDGKYWTMSIHLALGPQEDLWNNIRDSNKVSSGTLNCVVKL